MARGDKRTGAGRKPGISNATLMKRCIKDYLSEEERRALADAIKEEAIINRRPEMMRFLGEQVFGKASQQIEIKEIGRPIPLLGNARGKK